MAHGEGASTTLITHYRSGPEAPWKEINRFDSTSSPAFVPLIFQVLVALIPVSMSLIFTPPAIPTITVPVTPSTGSPAVTYDDVRGELERVLAVDDPGVFYRQLPEEQRNAVFRKELLEGMSTRAVEMAWGLPERKKIDRPANTEEWTWPGGRRTAFFEEDRLVRFEKKRP